MTNYERVKSMTAEEMALNLMGGRAFCPYNTFYEMRFCSDSCSKCISNWLEKECEENGKDNT